MSRCFLRIATMVALRLVALGTVLLPQIASAQGAGSLLSGPWHGAWEAAESNEPRLPGHLVIERAGAVSRLARADVRCELRYDGTFTVAELAQRVTDLRDWQMRPAHWPAGTDPQQLVGLRREFDRALALLQRVTPDTYRRVRTLVPGCDHANAESVYLLHKGQQLVRLTFPQESLGVDVTIYRRQP